MAGIFKFIHAADIHLDSPLKGLEKYDTAPVETIRGATRKALENLVRLAIREKVAFMLIAGDVYDGDWTDYGTGLFFRNAISQLAEHRIDVYMISGNHDAQSVVSRNLTMPEHVKVLSVTEPQTIALDSVGVAIHGQGFATKAVTANLCQAYPEAIPRLFNIGMLHTSAGGYEGHERYAPCSLTQMRDLKYDYWALGHIHKREVLSDAAAGNPYILFPGNIQGRHIGEAGAKGCTLVTVKEGRMMSAVHHDLDVFRWQLANVSLAGTGTLDEALTLTRDRLAQVASEQNGKPMAVRVEFAGTPRLHAQFLDDPDRWIAEMRAVAIEVSQAGMWVEKVKFRPTAAERPDEPIDPNGPAGELLAMLEAIKSDAQLRTDLSADLEDLRKRLPADLRAEVKELNLESPEQLALLLEDVRQLLLPQLGRLESGDSDAPTAAGGGAAAATEESR